MLSAFCFSFFFEKRTLTFFRKLEGVEDPEENFCTALCFSFWFFKKIKRRGKSGEKTDVYTLPPLLCFWFSFSLFKKKKQKRRKGSSPPFDFPFLLFLLLKKMTKRWRKREGLCPRMLSAFWLSFPPNRYPHHYPLLVFPFPLKKTACIFPQAKRGRSPPPRGWSGHQPGRDETQKKRRLPK